MVPMSVMVWAYVRMSAALRGHAIGECTHHQMQVVRAKRKVSVFCLNKLCATIALVYFLNF